MYSYAFCPFGFGRTEFYTIFGKEPSLEEIFLFMHTPPTGRVLGIVYIPENYTKVCFVDQ